MDVSNMPIEDVLAKLGLTRAGDFDQILELTKRIHQHRFESTISQVENAITRTSLFAACGLLARRAFRSTGEVPTSCPCCRGSC